MREMIVDDSVPTVAPYTPLCMSCLASVALMSPALRATAIVSWGMGSWPFDPGSGIPASPCKRACAGVLIGGPRLGRGDGPPDAHRLAGSVRVHHAQHPQPERGVDGWRRIGRRPRRQLAGEEHGRLLGVTVWPEVLRVDPAAVAQPPKRLVAPRLLVPPHGLLHRTDKGVCGNGTDGHTEHVLGDLARGLAHLLHLVGAHDDNRHQLRWQRPLCLHRLQIRLGVVPEPIQLLPFGVRLALVVPQSGGRALQGWQRRTLPARH